MYISKGTKIKDCLSKEVFCVSFFRIFGTSAHTQVSFELLADPLGLINLTVVGIGEEA